MGGEEGRSVGFSGEDALCRSPWIATGLKLIWPSLMFRDGT